MGAQDDDLTEFWDAVDPPRPPAPKEDFYASPVFCEHANEVPHFCPCGPRCYCKANTCRDRLVGSWDGSLPQTV